MSSSSSRVSLSDTTSISLYHTLVEYLIISLNDDGDGDDSDQRAHSDNENAQRTRAAYSEQPFTSYRAALLLKHIAMRSA